MAQIHSPLAGLLLNSTTATKWSVYATKPAHTHFHFHTHTHHPPRATPGGGGEGGVLDIINGRSRMTIHPRIYNAGTEHVGFSPIRHCLHQARNQGVVHNRLPQLDHGRVTPKKNCKSYNNKKNKSRDLSLFFLSRNRLV